MDEVYVVVDHVWVSREEGNGNDLVTNIIGIYSTLILAVTETDKWISAERMNAAPDFVYKPIPPSDAKMCMDNTVMCWSRGAGCWSQGTGSNADEILINLWKVSNG